MANLNFNCKVRNSNGEPPYINAAIFKAKNGDILRIDRQTTEYTQEIVGNTSDIWELDMIWTGCYLWEVNGESFEDGAGRELSDQELSDLLYGAELLELEVEDDAPEGYELYDISCDSLISHTLDR